MIYNSARVCILALCAAALFVPLGCQYVNSLGQADSTRCTTENLASLEKLDLGSLNKITKEGPFEETTEGASRNYFYDGKKIRAISANIMGEMGKSYIMYYFLNENNYMINTSIYRYSKPIYEPDWEIVSEENYRFYVCGGQLVITDSALNYDDLYSRYVNFLQILLKESNGLL